MIDYKYIGRSMEQKEILNILRKEKPFLKKQFGLLTIGLFGSYAKGQERAGSDIDLLVELIEPRFTFLAGLQIYLEHKFGLPVELVRKHNGMSDQFLNRIGKHIQYV